MFSLPSIISRNESNSNEVTIRPTSAQVVRESDNINSTNSSNNTNSINSLNSNLSNHTRNNSFQNASSIITRSNTNNNQNITNSSRGSSSNENRNSQQIQNEQTQNETIFNTRFTLSSFTNLPSNVSLPIYPGPPNSPYTEYDVPGLTVPHVILKETPPEYINPINPSVALNAYESLLKYDEKHVDALMERVENELLKSTMEMLAFKRLKKELLLRKDSHQNLDQALSETISYVQSVILKANQNQKMQKGRKKADGKGTSTREKIDYFGSIMHDDEQNDSIEPENPRKRKRQQLEYEFEDNLSVEDLSTSTPTTNPKKKSATRSTNTRKSQSKQSNKQSNKQTSEDITPPTKRTRKRKDSNENLDDTGNEQTVVDKNQDPLKTQETLLQDLFDTLG